MPWGQREVAALALGQRQTRRVRLHRGVALFLAAALLLLNPGQSGAGAVTQSEIDALKAEQAEYQKTITGLKEQLADLQGDQADALKQKDLLVAELAAIQGEIDNIDAQIAYYDGEIAAKEAQRLEAVAREEEQFQRFCERVRSMEEAGDTSYWAVLFNASDFSDLLDRAMMVEDIMAYDNWVRDELIATRQEIEQLKADLESARAQQQAARDQQEARRQEQSGKIAQVQALLDRINADADLVSQMLAAEESEENRIGEEIIRKQRELEAQRQQNNVVLPASPGGFLWPLDGYTRVNSGYGGRVHPVTGVYSGHGGIDIPAPSGTPIRAVKSGQVVTSTDNGGTYGRYVSIDHGGGCSSLYAHMSRRNCSPGDVVSRGDIIGYVGDSGRTTGNHLHLEIRLNYQRVNPLSVY